MTQRITRNDLEKVAERINVMTDNPTEPYSDGSTNVGHYCIDGAYGGCCLEQITNEAGGVRDVFRCGHIPKRELYHRMHAYIDGIRAERDADK